MAQNMYFFSNYVLSICASKGHAAVVNSRVGLQWPPGTAFELSGSPYVSIYSIAWMNIGKKSRPEIG